MSTPPSCLRWIVAYFALSARCTGVGACSPLNHRMLIIVAEETQQSLILQWGWARSGNDDRRRSIAPATPTHRGATLALHTTIGLDCPRLARGLARVALDVGRGDRIPSSLERLPVGEPPPGKSRGRAKNAQCNHQNQQERPFLFFARSSRHSSRSSAARSSLPANNANSSPTRLTNAALPRSVAMCH